MPRKASSESRRAQVAEALALVPDRGPSPSAINSSQGRRYPWPVTSAMLANMALENASLPALLSACLYVLLTGGHCDVTAYKYACTVMLSIILSLAAPS
ncbi:hypothetical protein PHYSODRAFT_331265 [Phytophthora sojae]|uniref:Uncharacterized protein n=1 Tax=Phytophthora sojae (strain P6497) TaxID=1094619 RepID=G4ZIL7_PHYSP|nr:hypothetical protein PHYSODRAFT_331265 [Phytophthora sojae]EGZ17261.1 hypothetical protein PHYSODRAFT_331265 [Phytophthora sojae]|eukprot:XP_009526319.1 hypothetical protein PHYSODRAFT_331265 [Phytophthora sojae]